MQADNIQRTEGESDDFQRTKGELQNNGDEELRGQGHRRKCRNKFIFNKNLLHKLKMLQKVVHPEENSSMKY